MKKIVSYTAGIALLLSLPLSAGAPAAEATPIENCQHAASDRALEACDAVLKTENDNYVRSVALAGRAWASYQKKQYDQALADFDSAIRLYPNAQRHYRRGLVHVAKQSFDLAIADFSSSIKLEADDPDVFIARGMTYLQQGQSSGALADFDAAVKLDPKNTKALYGRGVAKDKLARGSGNEDILAAQKRNFEVEYSFARRGLAVFLNLRGLEGPDFCRQLAEIGRESGSEFRKFWGETKKRPRLDGEPLVSKISKIMLPGARDCEITLDVRPMALARAAPRFNCAYWFIGIGKEGVEKIGESVWTNMRACFPNAPVERIDMKDDLSLKISNGDQVFTVMTLPNVHDTTYPSSMHIEVQAKEDPGCVALQLNADTPQNRKACAKALSKKR